MKCAIEPKHNIKSCDILLDSMILRKANILNENSQRFIGKTIIGFNDLSRIDRVCTCVRACVCMWSKCDSSKNLFLTQLCLIFRSGRTMYISACCLVNVTFLARDGNLAITPNDKQLYMSVR